MKKLLLTAAAASLGMGMAITPTAVVADDHAADEMEQLDQTWYRISLIKFHGGNDKRIGEIIDMFEATDKAVGVDGPVVIHMNTGEWDMMIFSHMKHGIAQMGWKDTPESKKWQAAFAEMAGGEEEAGKIYAEMQSYIAREENHIGHRHPDEEDEE